MTGRVCGLWLSDEMIVLTAANYRERECVLIHPSVRYFGISGTLACCSKSTRAGTS
jgi:hypothetical protein